MYHHVLYNTKLRSATADRACVVSINHILPKN